MRISFSMDGIKNMDVLYTYTLEKDRFGDETIGNEKYCGADYCKNVVESVWANLPPADWKSYEYLGALERIANESFIFTTVDGSRYQVSFAVNTYHGEAARLEVTLDAEETEAYDHRLEILKIALKDCLLPNWHQCTWLIDEQSVALCKDAYEGAFVIESALRAFASKVLIHFLGIDWIKRAGLEKQAKSVDNLKTKFTQRVPEFDNINTDFLSMTLETLVDVIFCGVIYKDEVTLSRQDYEKIQDMKSKGKKPGSDIADYIKKLRNTEKHIWDDLFVCYIENSEAFKTGIHNFIENRNHIAHSKVLSWSAYQVILRDFANISALISAADSKFEQDETSDEIAYTREIEQEELQDEYEYFRDRLSNEAGIDILNKHAIKDWFDEIICELYNDVYQQYHLNVCYEISDLSSSAGDLSFTILSPAVENGSARVTVIAEYSIDDDLGSDSVCGIKVESGDGGEICKAEICFHNGNGYENEDGLMEATDSSEYDTSELDRLKDKLFIAIESLNPYPEQLSALSIENKGAIQLVDDYPCEQCGKCGVSVNANFLPIGKCCYCGFENEMVECKRCGELVNIDNAESGFCPACTACIEKQ